MELLAFGKADWIISMKEVTSTLVFIRSESLREICPSGWRLSVTIYCNGSRRGQVYTMIAVPIPPDAENYIWITLFQSLSTIQQISPAATSLQLIVFRSVSADISIRPFGLVVLDQKSFAV